MPARPQAIPFLFVWVFVTSIAEAQPFTYTFVSTNLGDFDYGTAAWADYDNDGDPDLLLVGNTATEDPLLPSIATTMGLFLPSKPHFPTWLLARPAGATATTTATST